MDSVLSRLASRSEGGINALSLESDIVDASDYCDSQLNCLEDLSLSAASDADQIVGVIEGQDNLDTILDCFTTAHVDKEITEDAARQLTVSVESYLKAVGLNIPDRQWVPAFESSVQYSAELLDTRKSSATKIGAWLVEALKRILDVLKRWWGQLTLSIDAVSKYSDEVLAKVKTLKGDPKNKDPVKLGTSVNYLTDRHGAVAKPDKQLVETDTRFVDFLHEWSTMFDTEAHVLKHLPDLKNVKIEFVVGRLLEVIPGTGPGLLIDAKIKISQTVKAVKPEGPVLTLSEMTHALGLSKETLESLKKMQTEIARLDKLAKASAKEAEDLSKAYTDSDQGKAFSERARALAKAFQISSNGLTQVAPHYLKTIRACVEYVSICTRRYETTAQDK